MSDVCGGSVAATGGRSSSFCAHATRIVYVSARARKSLGRFFTASRAHARNDMEANGRRGAASVAQTFECASYAQEWWLRRIVKVGIVYTLV